MKKLPLLIVFFCLVTLTGQSQTVLRTSFSSFNIVNNDSLQIISGLLINSETYNPQKIFHGYYPLNYSLLGIKEKPQITYSIFPNPFQDFINIIFYGSTEENNIKIYSLSGSLVLQLKSVSNTASINLSKIKPGIYFVHIISPDNNTTIEKIIKY